MTTTLGVHHVKGGVGKTATAVNLSWLAAREGWRVLLVDLDPQGAATFYFRVRPKLRGGAKGLVGRKGDLAEAVRGTDWDDLDLLPSDFRLRDMDVVLDSEKKPRTRLRKALKPVARDYDLIVLDCPPGLTRTTEAIFASADALVVPVIPTTLSVRTLQQTRSFLAEQGGSKAPPLWPFFTMVDGRRRLHGEVMQQLPREIPEVLATRVPMSSDVERMGIERRPVGSFAPRSRGARAYRTLWNEVRQRLSDQE